MAGQGQASVPVSIMHGWKEEGEVSASDLLPQECLAHVFSFVDCDTRNARAGRVCRRWYEVATDDRAILAIMCQRAHKRDARTVTYRRSCARIPLRAMVDSPLPLVITSARHARVMRAALADHVECLQAALPLAMQELSQVDLCSFRFDVLAQAMRSGGSACARYLIEDAGWPLTESLTENAVVCANIDALRWLATMSHASVPTFQHAVRALQLVPTSASEPVRWDLWDEEPSPESRQRFSARLAACMDHVIRLSTVPLVRDHRLILSAAERGLVESMRVFHAAGFRMHSVAIRGAAKHGHVEAMRFAHECGCAWPVNVTAEAAEGGHLECLRYAHEHGAQWYITTTREAAMGGHLDCLRYCNDNGAAWHPYTISEAASYGRIEILEYAYSIGKAWPLETTQQAALARSLPCLQFAHEHGATWHPQTKAAAMGRGDLECLKYAHDHGAPWDDSVSFELLFTSREDILDCICYALRHGCPNASAPAVDATRRGELDVLRHLHEAGGSAVWSPDVCAYGASGRWRPHRQCLYYAHEHGCAWDTRVWIQAAACGDLNLMAYALCHGCECDVELVRRAAQRGGQVRAIEFLALAHDFGLITVSTSPTPNSKSMSSSAG